MRALASIIVAACAAACSSPTTPDVPSLTTTGADASTGPLGAACVPDTSCGVIHTRSCEAGDDACKADAFCAADGACVFLCSTETRRQLCAELGGGCIESTGHASTCRP